MINKIIDDLQQTTIKPLLDFADWIRAELEHTYDYLQKNKLLIKLTQIQKILNKIFTIQKDIQNLENDKILKRDIEKYNVLLVEQSILKDYIYTVNCILGKWDIPKDELQDYTQQLLNEFYIKIKEN